MLFRVLLRIDRDSQTICYSAAKEGHSDRPAWLSFWFGGKVKSTSSLFEDFAQEEHKAKAIEAGYTEMAVFQLRNK